MHYILHIFLFVVTNCIISCAPIQWPKHPDIPEGCCERTMPTLKVPASQIVSLFSAHNIDQHLFQNIVDTPWCTPDDKGFNVILARNRGHSVKREASMMPIYTPLMDMPSYDPDTTMSVIIEAQRLPNECGQAITVFTNVQQLQRVATTVA